MRQHGEGGCAWNGLAQQLQSLRADARRQVALMPVTLAFRCAAPWVNSVQSSTPVAITIGTVLVARLAAAAAGVPAVTSLDLQAISSAAPSAGFSVWPFTQRNSNDGGVLRWPSSPRRRLKRSQSASRSASGEAVSRMPIRFMRTASQSHRPSFDQHRRTRHRQRPRHLDRGERQRPPAQAALPHLVDRIEFGEVSVELQHAHDIVQRRAGSGAELLDVADDELGLRLGRRREMRLARADRRRPRPPLPSNAISTQIDPEFACLSSPAADRGTPFRRTPRRRSRAFVVLPPGFSASTLISILPS